jgi:hypothetical protein
MVHVVVGVNRNTMLLVEEGDDNGEPQQELNDPSAALRVKSGGDTNLSSEVG